MCVCCILLWREPLGFFLGTAWCHKIPFSCGATLSWTAAIAIQRPLPVDKPVTNSNIFWFND